MCVVVEEVNCCKDEFFVMFFYELCNLFVLICNVVEVMWCVVSVDLCLDWVCEVIDC